MLYFVKQGTALFSDIKDNIRGTLVINDQSEIPKILNELDQRGIQYQIQKEQPIDGGNISLLCYMMPEMGSKDALYTLGFDEMPEGGQAEVHTRYLQLIKEAHPDPIDQTGTEVEKAAANEKLKIFNEAYGDLQLYAGFSKGSPTTGVTTPIQPATEGNPGQPADTISLMNQPASEGGFYNDGSTKGTQNIPPSQTTLSPEVFNENPYASLSAQNDGNNSGELSLTGNPYQALTAENQEVAPETVEPFDKSQNLDYNGLEGNEGAGNKAGITKAKVDDILKTLKYSRPDPKTYLSKEHIANHEIQFSKGVTKISIQAPSGYAGPPGGTYVMPTFVADDLIARAGGNISELERLLGLNPGDLGTNPVRIDITTPIGLRMPSGNEKGANQKWIPGGYTRGGIP